MAIDFFSLALSKQYTEDTSDALGAVKGAPCTIKSIEESDGGSLITFEWTGTSGKTETSTLFVKDGKDGVDGLDGKDGSTGRDGRNGSDGKDGTDGVGISKIEKIDTQGLIDTYRITFTNEVTFDYEITNGKDGKDGEYSSGNSNNGSIVESHTHENKEVLDIITSEKITEWNNKSEFDGSYNSLTDTPTDFPTVNGHTVESNVPKNAVFTDTIYDDSAIKSRLSNIENTYLTKNEIEDSIETAKQEAITSILGGTVEEDFDTLKEVATWILADQTNSAELINRVTEIEKHYLKGTDKTELQQMISNLQNFVGELPTESTSTTAISYIQEVVDGLNIGNYALASDLTSLAQRVTTIENTLKNKVDKIDGKGLSTNDYDNTEKSTVAQNKSDIASLNEEVGLLDLQTTNSTTLYNSKDGGVKLNHMVGKTEQKQYNGYQLFDASRLPTKTQGGATVTNNGDGSFTVSGEGELNETFTLNYSLTKEQALSLLKIGTLCIAPSNFTCPKFSFGLYDIQGASKKRVSNNEKEETIMITQEDLDMIDSGKTVVRAYFYGANDATITPGTIKPMLYQEGDGTWEPFTDGQQSPNPEYPQSLNHTGDCVEMVNGDFSLDTGEHRPNKKGYVINKYPIPCNIGDVIKTITESKMYHYIAFYNNGTFVKSTHSSSKTMEMGFNVPNGVTHFNICFGNENSNITPESVGKIELTVNGKYVGQIVEHGKNLLVHILGANTESIINGVTCTKNGDGTYTVNGTATDTCEFRIGTIKLSSGIYKTVGCPSGGSSSKYRNYVTNINTGISSEGGNGNIFTLLEDSNDIRFYIRIERGVTVSNLLFKPMITMDITATYDDFEPYQEHIATFYMDEPLRDSDRLVQVDGLWQIERNSAEVVFDGSDDEDWRLNSPVEELLQMYIPFSDGFTLNRRVVLCDKLRVDSAGGDNNKSKKTYVINFNNNGNNLLIDVPDSVGTTVSDFKYWLSENPITVEYQLATPTYEVLDTTSQIALNSLKSFNGVTYVEFDSRVQPQEVSFDYGTSRVGALAIKNELRENIRDIRMKELELKYEELAALISGSNSGESTEPVDLDENGETGETESVEPTTE